MSRLTPDPRCYVCDMYGAFYDFSLVYGKDVYAHLLDPVWMIFKASMGAWLAWQILFHLILKADFDRALVLKNLGLFCVIGMLLKGSSFYWEFLHEPFLQGISSIAQVIILRSGDRIQEATFESVLWCIDAAWNRTVFQLWALLVEEAGWTSWKPLMAGIIFIIPYMATLCIFLALLIDFIFSILLVTAISPLIFIAIGFESTRPMAINILRIGVTGTFTLLFSCLAMGFTLAVFEKFVPLIPVSGGGPPGDIAGFIFSKSYWAMWILGFISGYFHLRARYYAMYVSGTFLATKGGAKRYGWA